MATHVKVSEELSASSDSDGSAEIDREADESDGGQENGGATGVPATGGMADVMAKILRKQAPKHKTVIMGKGRTDKQIIAAKLKKEEEDEEDEVPKKKKKRKDAESSSDSEDGNKLNFKDRSLKKKMWEEMCRLKPDVTKKDRERMLQRIATKGVVQLFNAVKKQQKTLTEKLDAVGDLEFKKERVLKSVTKGDFLDMLKGTTVNAVTAEQKVEKRNGKRNTEEKEEPSWKILRDDFMMGAKMKDWDKESEEEEGDEEYDGDSSGADT